MVCLISLIIASGISYEQVKVKQVLLRVEGNYKIVYEIPQDVSEHFLNRGISWVSADKCVSVGHSK